jgi:hypothetical protein
MCRKSFRAIASVSLAPTSKQFHFLKMDQELYLFSNKSFFRASFNSFLICPAAQQTALAIGQRILWRSKDEKQIALYHHKSLLSNSASNPFCFPFGHISMPVCYDVYRRDGMYNSAKHQPCDKSSLRVQVCNLDPRFHPL